MWQDILAVDTKLIVMSQKQHYLKRRMQLLQAKEMPHDHGEDDPDLWGGAGGGPVRNKRYLSLRVKLLKRQFGLPNEASLSMKSLSLDHNNQNNATATATTTTTTHHFHNQHNGNYSYSGVRHIFDHHRAKIRRLSEVKNNASLMCLDESGKLSECDLNSGSFAEIVQDVVVVDFDVCCGTGGEFLVSAHSNSVKKQQQPKASITVWNRAERGGRLTELRSVSVSKSIDFCRFLPDNENLILCIGGNDVSVFNASTGKVDLKNAAVIGRPKCFSWGGDKPNHGVLFWVANDKGHLEAFKVDYEESDKVVKGSRCNLRENIHSISVKANLVLVAVQSGLKLYSVTDTIGSLMLTSTLDMGKSFPMLKCVSLCSSVNSAACGGEDGSFLFVDISSKLVVNKLMGHSSPVSAVLINEDESLTASADSAGQIIVWKK